MSIASVVIIILLIVIYSRGYSSKERLKKLLGILLIFICFMGFGYFLRIGSFSLDFEELITLLIGLECLFGRVDSSGEELTSSKEILPVQTVTSKYIRQHHATRDARNAIIPAAIFVFLIIVSALYEWIVPYKGGVYYSIGIRALDYVLYDTHVDAVVNIQTFRYGIRIILFLIIAIRCLDVLSYEDFEDIMSPVYKVWPFIIAYCIFEFSCKNILHVTWYQNLCQFIFRESGKTESERLGYIIITGLKYEPTQLSTGLWQFVLLLLISRKNYMYTLISLAVCFALTFLSGSLKGIEFIFVGLMIYCITGKLNAGTWLGLLGVSMFGLLYIFLSGRSLNLEYYIQRINNVFSILTNGTDSLSEVSSESHRLKTIYDGFRNFIDRPFLGIGLGVNHVYGAVPMILSNCGILGTLSYLSFLGYIGFRFNSIKDVIVILGIVVIYITTGSIATVYDMGLFLFLAFYSSYFYGGYFECTE